MGEESLPMLHHWFLLIKKGIFNLKKIHREFSFASSVSRLQKRWMGFVLVETKLKKGVWNLNLLNFFIL